MKICKRHGGDLPCHKCRDIARHAALKRDALRYRFLRSRVGPNPRGLFIAHRERSIVMLSSEAADSVIDATMRVEAATKTGND